MNQDVCIQKDSKKFANTGDNATRLHEKKCMNEYELIEIEHDDNQLPLCTEDNADELQESFKNNINQVKKLSLISFKSHEDFLTHLKSPDFNNLQFKSDEILFISFQINEIFHDFKASQLNELSEKFINNSVVIKFESDVDKKSFIYWKSKELEYFVSLKSYNGANSELYDFIATVLVESLKNGHLGLDKNYQLNDETNKIDIIYLCDTRNYNLLFLAVENGNADLAQYLLKFGMNTEIQNMTIQQLALQNSHYNVILELLKANLTFPDSIDINTCPEDFKNICGLTVRFHEMIKVDDLEKIKEIYNQLPKTHNFYNLENESALKVAVKNKSFNAYDFLVSQKLLFGPHEDPEEYFQELEYADQKILREIHNKYTQDSPEKHINVLMTKSFISHDELNANSRLDIVHRAYRTLNANVLIKIILMIVAASKKFKIIFDFNRDSVNISDPTVDSNTYGLFYPSGRIYIGAKQLLDDSTENEALATIAHEFCHFAMNLAYKNYAKPYSSNDHLSMQEFEEVSKICQENIGHEDVIDMVYEYYDEEMHHAELIVRVVHLVALYRNQSEKIEELRSIFGRLFDFYEKKIIPELKAALPEIDERAEKEIEKKDEKISRLTMIAVMTGFLCIVGIISVIVVAVVLHKPVLRFKELSESEKLSVKNALVTFNNFDVMFHDLFSENSTIYEHLPSEQISLILDCQKLNIDDPQLKFLKDQIYFNWRNLTEVLKQKFLNSTFAFQNEILQFQDLYEKIPQAFDEINAKQISDVLDEKELQIGNVAVKHTSFYMDRLFMYEDVYAIFYIYKYLDSGRNAKNFSEENFRNFYNNFRNQNSTTYAERVDEIRQSVNFKGMITSSLTVNFGQLLKFHSFHESLDQIINKTTDSKFFILSAEAGAGKTVTFENLAEQIKKKYPTRWVAYIDLKKYTKFYSNNNENLIENILDLKSKNNFESHIFLELYKTGHVVLLWNGFDEISPKYSDFIIETLSMIRNTTENVQFTCTRPLFSNLLRDNMDVRPSTLLPFDDQQQDEFLRQIFESKNIENYQIYVEKVHKIINALKSAPAYKNQYDFYTPLILKMIANLMTNPEFHDHENLYKIYETIINENIEIWYNKTEISLTSFRKFDWMKIFQKFALKHELPYIDSLANFNSKKLEISQLQIPSELTYDEISKVGILFINSDNDFEFAHKTFAEFFVAQFFIENIYSPKNVKMDESEMILQIFLTIAREYNRHQVMITNFINYFVKDETEGLFDSTIAELMRTKFRGIFIDFLYKMETENFEFLVNFFKKDHKLLVDLLHVNDNETFYTATFNCDYTLYSIIKKVKRNLIKNLAHAHLTDEEYERFINGRNQKGVIEQGIYKFHSYYNVKIDHSTYKLTDWILNETNPYFALRKIAKDLTREEHIELISRPEGLVDPRDVEMFKHDHFWYVFINKWSLMRREFKDMFTNLFFGLTKMNFDIQYLPILFNKTKEKFSDSEIFEIITSRNILHLAVHNRAYFTSLWDFLRKHATRAQLKELLIKKEYGGCTTTFGKRYNVANRMCYDYPSQNIFQIALNPHYGTIYNDAGNSFDYIKHIYEDFFKTAEKQELVSDSIDILPYIIWSHRLDICKKFGIYLKNLFEGNEKMLKIILLQKIESTSLTIFEYMDNVEYANELKVFSDLL